MIIGKYRVNIDDNTLCRCGFSKGEIEAEIDDIMQYPEIHNIMLKKVFSDNCTLVLWIPKHNVSVLKDFNPDALNEVGVAIPKEYWGKPIVLMTKQDYTLYPTLGYELCSGYISFNSGKIKTFNACNMDKFKFFKILKDV